MLYKEEFEKNKGKGFSVVADTPEMQRIKKTQDQISNVGHRQHSSSSSVSFKFLLNSQSSEFTRSFVRGLVKMVYSIKGQKYLCIWLRLTFVKGGGQLESTEPFLSHS